jgi:O-antigen ligase
LLALLLPALLAFHQPPSMTFFNQVASVVGWGVWLAFMPALSWAGGRAPDAPAWARRGMAGLAVVWAGYGLASLGSWAWWADLPVGLAWMHAGLSAAALTVAWTAWRLRGSQQWDEVVDLFLWGLTLAGLANFAIGLMQAYHPQWADGAWLAAPTMPGRAVGNLRQPNHLSTLLVQAGAAAAALGARRRLPALVASGLVALMVWGVVLSASRTGMLGMAFFTVWGLLDRRLPKALRWTLIAAPLVYGFWWGSSYVWSHLHPDVTFAAEARLHDHSDISSSRFKIWANVLALIAQHPWWGVGVGEFNVAWSFTPFPTRPVAFFDHTHNVLLQWAVELGLPAAALLTAGSAAAMWPLMRAWRSQAEAPDNATEASEATHAAWRGVLGASGVMVGIAVLHSMLEYPLWYGHLLMPTAFAWGLGLSAAALLHGPARREPASPPPAAGRKAKVGGMALCGATMAVLGLWCTLDYLAASDIYAPHKGAAPLEQRIALSQRMPWWGYQADYAEVTVPDDDEPALPPQAFRRTLHNLVDSRLMMAYARSLAEHGQVDEARYVVARLREFRNPAAKAFFEVCEEQVEGAEQPFQCSPPSRTYTWREVLPAR